MYLENLIIGCADFLGVRGIERCVHGTSAMALGLTSPRIIDHNGAHGLSSVGEEMLAVIDGWTAGALQPQERFMHQGRGIEQRVTTTGGKSRTRKAAQFRVEPWEILRDHA